MHVIKALVLFNSGSRLHFSVRQILPLRFCSTALAAVGWEPPSRILGLENPVIVYLELVVRVESGHWVLPCHSKETHHHHRILPWHYFKFTDFDLKLPKNSFPTRNSPANFSRSFDQEKGWARKQIRPTQCVHDAKPAAIDPDPLRGERP